MPDHVTAYWHSIERGEVIVCEKTRRIYERLAKEIAEDRGRWTFDAKRANRPIRFMAKFCRHSKGEWAGRPLILEQWQAAFVSALFGFVDRQTHERRFTEAFLCIARKGGKSTLAAGILLYLFVCEGQADVFTAATKLDQASLIFEECMHMVEQSPYLSRRIRKRRTDMYLAATKSKFKPLGKQSNTLDGLNSSALGCDEVHAWSGPQGRDLYAVLKQSQSARTSTVLLITTTAGTVRGGVFDDLYGLSERILAGSIDEDRFLPVIYESDPERWDDPREWYKSNPSLEPQGMVKKLEFMQGMARRAMNDPKTLSEFRCKDLNIRETSSSAWLSFTDLNNEATFSLDDFSGTWAIGGVDLSQTTDLTAACILMYRAGTFYAYPMFWIPADSVAERVRRDMIPYDVWHERGLVRYCKGNVIDPHDVVAWFLEVVNEHGISVRWIGYDPYCSRYFTTELEGYGFEMVRVRQGHATESVPLQNMGQLFKAHKINYDNNPVLLWNLTNAGVEVSRNNTIALVKAGQPRQRIDGVAALMDAFVVYYDHAGEFLQLCGEE